MKLANARLLQVCERWAVTCIVHLTTQVFCVQARELGNSTCVTLESTHICMCDGLGKDVDHLLGNRQVMNHVWEYTAQRTTRRSTMHSHQQRGQESVENENGWLVRMPQLHVRVARALACV